LSIKLYIRGGLSIIAKGKLLFEVDDKCYQGFSLIFLFQFTGSCLIVNQLGI